MIMGITWVNTLRREGNEEFTSNLEPRFLKSWKNGLISSSWVGNTFKYDELIGMQICNDFLRCRSNVRNVRIFCLA